MMTNAGGIGLATVRRAQLFRTTCPFTLAPNNTAVSTMAFVSGSKSMVLFKEGIL